MFNSKANALKNMRSHIDNFDNAMKSMAKRTAWLVQAIEMTKTYLGEKSIIYKTISIQDFYIEISHASYVKTNEDEILSKLDQKTDYIKELFNNAIKHVEMHGVYKQNELKQNIFTNYDSFKVWGILSTIAIFSFGAGYELNDILKKSQISPTVTPSKQEANDTSYDINADKKYDTIVSQ